MTGTDPALKLFWLMNAARLAGLAGILLGIAGFVGELAMPQALAIVLMGAGLFGFFFLPTLVARRGKGRK